MAREEILKMLFAERDRLDRAIEALGGVPNPKRVMSPESRAKIAKSMKNRWAANKKSRKQSAGS
jgi:hypothetical protein